ncbi:Small ribosomal subunit biogenesis GTPase RsgA, partial [Frankliniella fusca]
DNEVQNPQDLDVAPGLHQPQNLDEHNNILENPHDADGAHGPPLFDRNPIGQEPDSDADSIWSDELNAGQLSDDSDDEDELYNPLLGDQDMADLLIQPNENNADSDHQKFFPTSKKELWKVLGRSDAGIVAHMYCDICQSYVGKKKEMGEFIVCPQCNTRKAVNKASYFVTLSLEKQLEYFFSIPGIAEHLAYRENRLKHTQEAIEDIYDGSEYRSIEVDGMKLINSNNFTMTLNLDGCKAKKGGKLTMMPVFLKLNELPPNLQQKCMFLAAIHVDKKEPNMVTYLHPVVKMLNKLAREGVTWSKNNEEVVSKIIVPTFCVDGKACAQVLNMVQHVSHFGCPCCTYYGISVNTTMRYPFQHPDLPPYAPRTNATMKQQMIEAEDLKTAGRADFIVQGHKGITPLMDLDYLDLAKGNCADDLHYIYECGALQHTEIFLKELPRLDNDMSEKALLETIDLRMRAIKTPSCIARKPGSCQIKNRKQWHGNEWRNWLWYCSVICLHGLFSSAQIHHLEILSYASYLLSQDIILPAHIDRAEELLREYLSLYDNFGLEKTRRNLHDLLHASDCVRRWGALWCYSTFNFESWNHCLMQLVSSPKGALLQIVTRHLIKLNLDVAISIDEQVSPDVKDELLKILKKPRHVRARQLGEHIYVMGPSTSRPVTHAENEVLNRETFQPQQLNSYKKMLIRSTVYTTSSYQQDHESKSDDSSVYTFTNIVCTIQDIVTFMSEDGSEVCGLFALQNTVKRPKRPLFPYAEHICEVEMDNGDLLFIRPEDKRSPVLK